MPKSSSSRSFEELETALIEALAPLHNPKPDDTSYYAPYYVNLRENARRVIGNLPFTDRAAFAGYAWAKMWPDNRPDDWALNGPKYDAMDAALSAIMIALAFEDAPDATEAKARTAFLLSIMSHENDDDYAGITLSQHWHDDALRTIARDLELIAGGKPRGLQAVAA